MIGVTGFLHVNNITDLDEVIKDLKNPIRNLPVNIIFINGSFRLGIFTSVLKISLVIPLHLSYSHISKNYYRSWYMRMMHFFFFICLYRDQ